MKSSLLLLGLSVAFVSQAYGQKNAPDALKWENPEKLLEQYRLVDSVSKKWPGSLDLDSLKRQLEIYRDGAESLKGSAKGFAPGVLLDQRGISESDGFIKDGQKYYIRNYKPAIEAKEVSPNVYQCK